MAQIKSTRWSRFVLKVGDGKTEPGPEGFTPKCSINSATGITFTANVSEDTIPECGDLEKIKWLIREKVSLSVEVTGAGRNHKSDVKDFLTWWKSPEARNCILVLDDPDPANVIEIKSAFHLTNYVLAADEGTPTVTNDITIVSTGEVTETYGANVGGA